MTKVNVLVFPCGSEIGLELHSSLRWSKNLRLFGASSVNSDHGSFVYENFYSELPFISSPDFIPALSEFVDKNRIDFLFPAHDDVVLELAKRSSELNCTVIGSPFATCEITRSKAKTYEYLGERGLPVPNRYSIADRLTYPIFLKPDVGQGSKGTQIVNSDAELRFYLEQDPSRLILEYLPGNEYTVDCVTDARGLLVFAAGRERLRIQNGISVRTKPIDDPQFYELAEKINEHLILRGAWFFQVKKNERDELTILEVAPRIAGSMGLYRNHGVNFGLLSLYVAAGEDIICERNSCYLELDRALFSRYKTNINYDHVYVDLDDTLIVNGRVNNILVSFLYQCVNRGVKIHLVTRCEGNLEDRLRSFRLWGLFDSISHLMDRSLRKSAYVGEHKSIFIDDSFAERHEVSKALGIPVFDLDAVECLLDWRI